MSEAVEQRFWVTDTIYRVELTDEPLELTPDEEIVRTSYDSPHFHVFIRTGSGD